jgi:hypothetical protein
MVNWEKIHLRKTLIKFQTIIVEDFLEAYTIQRNIVSHNTYKHCK